MIPEAGAVDLERLDSKGGLVFGSHEHAQQQFGLECRAGSASSLASDSSPFPESYCWICLDGEVDGRGPLISPCNCPNFRLVHPKCLARWQLQSAGTRREKVCDFCNCELPDWRSALTPPDTGASAPAIMNVNFGGTTYSFEVRPGPEGYQEFTNSIRSAFSLPMDSELNITFTCDEPSTGSLLTLQGAGAYDAAVHCASVSAARRGNNSSLSSCSNPASTAGSRASPGAGTGHRRASNGHRAGRPSVNRFPHAISSLGQRLRNALQELFV